MITTTAPKIQIPRGFKPSHDTYMGTTSYTIYTHPGSTTAYALAYGGMVTGSLNRDEELNCWIFDADNGTSWDAFEK